MKKKINLKDILDKFDKYNCISEAQLSDIIPAMKEACRQALELAAENSKIEIKEVGEELVITDLFQEDAYSRIQVNVKSILNTINQIE